MASPNPPPDSDAEDESVPNVDPEAFVLDMIAAGRTGDVDAISSVYTAHVGVDIRELLEETSWTLLALALSVGLLLLPLALVWVAYVLLRRVTQNTARSPSAQGPFDAVREYIGDCYEEAADEVWGDTQWRRAALAIPGIFAFACVSALIAQFKRG